MEFSRINLGFGAGIRLGRANSQNSHMRSCSGSRQAWKRGRKSWNWGFFQPGTHLRSQGFFEGVGSCQEKGKLTLRDDQSQKKFQKKKPMEKLCRSPFPAQEGSRNSKPQESSKNLDLRHPEAAPAPSLLDFPSLNSMDLIRAPSPQSIPNIPNFRCLNTLKTGISQKSMNVPQILEHSAALPGIFGGNSNPWKLWENWERLQEQLLEV